MDTEYFVLPNGIKCCLVNIPFFETTCVYLRVKAGSNFESKKQIGSSHLLEHLILDKLRSNLEIPSKIIGVTSRDDILYGFHILKNDLNPTLSKLAEVFSYTAFPKVFELNFFKNQVLSEIKRHLENPEKALPRLSHQLLFKDCRLAKLNTGSISDVKVLTTTSLQNFYHQNYSTSNVSLTVCGNINLTELKKQVFDEFSVIQTREHQNEIALIPFTKTKKHITITKMNRLTLFYGRINWYGATYSDLNKYTLLLLASVFKSEIKKKLGDTVNIVDVNSHSAPSYGIFSVYFVTYYKDYTKIISQVLSVLENLKFDEIDIQKSKLLLEITSAFEKLSLLTDHLSEENLFSKSISRPADIINLVNHIQIEQLQKRLEFLLNQTPRTLVFS